MRLQEIELIGFKTFYNKTKIVFEDGISAIVGPNGCGKSNIVDAVKWVLGEQSPKSLRGSKMEDVIFAGNEKRKPVGMAQVTLRFKIHHNTSEEAEIEVSRRSFRDGENQYFLNGRQCRLKDIYEYFLDTGVGMKGYSIMEQGKVDQLVNARPDERRALIEEAAGVMKYKMRRKETLSKLEAVEQNLLRINDILKELKAQYVRLRRQARNAEKFKEYQEQIRYLFLESFADKYLNLQTSLKESQKEYQLVQENRTRLSATKAILDADLETLKIELMDIEQKLRYNERTEIEIQSELKRIEESIFMLKNREVEDKSQAIRLKDEISHLLKSIEDSTATINDQLNLIAKLETEIGKKKEVIDKLARTQQDRRILLSEKEAILQKKRNSCIELVSELSRKRNEKSSCETRLKELDHRHSRLKKEREELVKQIKAVKEKTFIIEEKIKLEEKEFSSLNQKLAKLNSSRECQIKNLQTLQNQINEQKKDLASKKSRWQSLGEMKENLMGLEEGTKAILKEFLAENPNWGIQKLLADTISTNKEYEIAVEIALNERLKAILIDQENAVLKPIQFLKLSKKGRASFLLLNALPVEEERHFNLDHPGIIAKLDEIINAENISAHLIRKIAKNIFIVDSLETALEIKKTNRGNFTLITCDGDIVKPDGLIIGGSTDTSFKGILSLQREISELALSIRSLEETISELQQILEKENTEISNLDKEIRTLNDRIEEWKIASIHRQNEIEKLHSEEKRLCTQLKAAEAELELCRAEKEEIIRKQDQIIEIITQMEKEKSGLERDMEALNQERQKLQDEIDHLNNELSEIRAEISGQTEKIEGLKRSANDKRREITEKTNRKEMALKALKEIENRREDTAKVQQKLEHNSVELYEKLSQINNLIKELQEIYEEKSKKEEELKKSIKNTEIKIAELQERSNELRLEISKTEMSIQAEEKLLYDKFQIYASEALKSFIPHPVDHQANAQKIQKLQDKISRMGEINLAAIEDFKEIEKRYNFMLLQKQDIEEAINSLNTALQKIDATSKNKFLEAFSVINNYFNEIFVRLFDGGKAMMLITDDDEGGGIEIVAQPPGKKNQRLSLLSGGEKALIALALLTAVYLYKPSPFYILDEVDAPLDDANIQRFLTLIKDLSTRSQIILITHNQISMEAADILYGITMEEPGISKIVSVRLKNKEVLSTPTDKGADSLSLIS